jgi:hypothetical protein
MQTLAKRAIRVFRCALVDVRQLDYGAKNKEDRKESNE